MSFSAKIKIAHAIGVIGDEAKDDLEKIRTVRNTFAHSILEIDFETPEIQAVCKSIKVPAATKAMAPKIDEDWEIETAKGIFLMAVTLYSAIFLYEPEADAQEGASPDKPER